MPVLSRSVSINTFYAQFLELYLRSYTFAPLLLLLSSTNSLK